MDFLPMAETYVAVLGYALSSCFLALACVLSIATANGIFSGRVQGNKAAIGIVGTFGLFMLAFALGAITLAVTK